MEVMTVNLVDDSDVDERQPSPIEDVHSTPPRVAPLRPNLRFKRSRPFLNPDGSEQKQISIATASRARELIDRAVPDHILSAIQEINMWVHGLYVPPRDEVYMVGQVNMGQVQGLQDVDDVLTDIAFEARRKANALVNRIFTQAARD